MSNTFYPSRPLLIVDDELSWLRSLALRLEGTLGINHISTADNGAAALAKARDSVPSLVLLDLTMPGLSGEEVLVQLLEEYPGLPVIIHTAHNEVEIAVRCMKLGAFDYFIKTAEQDRLLTGIQRALTMVQLRAENLLLQEHLVQRRLQHPEVFQELVTRSQALFDLCAYLEAIAPSREPLLITGESGVGKELVARALWRLATPTGPWQAVNVAGLDDNVFADTLFGHVRGAYTGADQARSGLVEQASGGVLFLDEIGDLSPASQVKLLRLLQGGDYLPLGSDRPKRANARIVAATNLDLEKRVSERAFRRDLYYRLKAHHAHLPPLRERSEDIPLLSMHFAGEAAVALGRRPPIFTDELLDRLTCYPFPGNVRELRSLIFDAVSRCHGESFELAHFPMLQKVPCGTAATEGSSIAAGQIVYPHRLPTLDEAAVQLILEAMRRSGGNQTVAARMLGITRQGLAKRLKK